MNLDDAIDELDEAVRDLCKAIERAPHPHDSMELVERLQMAMDRVAMVDEHLSNILKKSSKTARAVIQNMH